MSPLLIYLAKSVLSIIAIYFCYILVLKKEPIFQFNRIFLLLSLLVASILPLFEFNLLSLFSSTANITPEYLVTYQLSEVYLDEITISNAQSQNWFSPIKIIISIYFAGVLFKLVQLILRLSHLLVFAAKHQKLVSSDSKIIILEKDIPTFSFFRLIFIDERTYKNKEAEIILKHEQVHISHLHSFDLLLVELITIIQWFNPFVYLIKKSIKDNHEFIADQEVVATNCNQSSYRLLLMEQASNIKTNVLAHNFSYSLLKRRLYMINKPKRPLRIGFALFGAIVALGFVLFACSTPVSDEQITRIDEPAIEMIEDAYTVVETMPEYPGGMDSLVTYLSRNIQYPAAAKEAGTQGTVYVNFIIEKDGTVSTVKTIRSVSEDCDNEAMRVVSLMPDWIPGKQNGKAVRVSFNLPISFKLNDSEKKVTRIKIIDDLNKDTVFQVVEQMPEYPGGFDQLAAYLSANIKYPEQAKKDNISGRVFVRFIVEKNGNVSNTKVIRGIGGGCDEEAFRIVSNMPDWKPGLDENGNAVRVQYNLPIKFSLD